MNEDTLIFDGMYYTPSVFRSLWEHLVEKYKSEYFVDKDAFANGRPKNWARVYGDPVFRTEPDTINVLGIRYNHEISFNNDLTNNDNLIIWENTSSNQVRLWRFPVTMDPKSKKVNIAHLVKGVYPSYRVGNHRQVPGRTALRQDDGVVLVARTDKKGEVFEVQTGKFGINIHDSGGFSNSSLGCTILANDDDYKNKYKPLLLRVKAQRNITYVVSDLDDVSEYLNRINPDSLIPKPLEILRNV